MDFARKLLQNYGWRDGDGLGKNKDGIAKPLKATLKFDKSGFGADQAASDFNNHWWERVYNEAAENVKVSEEDEQIKMALKDYENSVEISTKGFSVKKLKKLKENSSRDKSDYDNFLQAATLTSMGNEIENNTKINTKDIEVSKVNVLTDEELFKACGGRTAHKGARHGLKLSGKLLRIQQQEAELLAKLNSKRNDINKEEKQTTNKLEAKSTKSENPVRKESDKLKKKKRKHCQVEIYETFTANEKIAVTERKNKKISKKDIALVENVDQFLTKDDDVKKDSTKKKQKKNKDKNVDNCAEEIIHKKKNKHKD